MNARQYFVRIYCPALRRQETVYFSEVVINGEYYLEFNGCDTEFHTCRECDSCQKAAYQKLLDQCT